MGSDCGAGLSLLNILTALKGGEVSFKVQFLLRLGLPLLSARYSFTGSPLLDVFTGWR